ncbi:MAG: hypothetical protein Q8M73_00050 [Actinomycetota bacterium]|nr:hypothetical protein [Actinomycetota bacterium]
MSRTTGKKGNAETGGLMGCQTAWSLLVQDAEASITSIQQHRRAASVSTGSPR